jgi:hypothetical protein
MVKVCPPMVTGFSPDRSRTSWNQVAWSVAFTICWTSGFSDRWGPRCREVRGMGVMGGSSVRATAKKVPAGFRTRGSAVVGLPGNSQRSVLGERRWTLASAGMAGLPAASSEWKKK